jgi:hypothetical protein
MKKSEIELLIKSFENLKYKNTKIYNDRENDLYQRGFDMGINLCISTFNTFTEKMNSKKIKKSSIIKFLKKK